MERTLGTSGLTVSGVGLGCWAIGGDFTLDGRADGYGAVDDAESVRAIQRALELGVTFFDTADAYGTGHSERVLGRALRGRRDDVVVATKFGYVYDETTREVGGINTTKSYVRRALERSLRRLAMDHVDLYQLHVWSIPEDEALAVFDALDRLQDEGLIRAYGWSTGEPANVRLAAERSRAASIQHPLNLFNDAPEVLALCEARGLASIANGPLAMGLLTGKFATASRLPAEDVRGAGHDWVPYFEDGRPREDLLERLGAVREILTSGGRTLAQGALAWIWARSPQTIPIPGFKSVAQVEENAGAMRFGPLTAELMAEVGALLVPPVAVG